MDTHKNFLFSLYIIEKTAKKEEIRSFTEKKDIYYIKNA